MPWSDGCVASLSYWLAAYWWSVYPWCVGLCGCGSGSGGVRAVVWLVGCRCCCSPGMTGFESDSFGGVCGFWFWLWCCRMLCCCIW
jgi:hypothetical protein